MATEAQTCAIGILQATSNEQRTITFSAKQTQFAGYSNEHNCLYNKAL